MKFIRLAGVASSLFIALLLTGCGDTFRPIVTPFPTPGGDPEAARSAFVLSHGTPQPNTLMCADGTPPPCVGASTEIDVSGDTNVGNRVQGREPWHAQIGTSAVSLYVANRNSNTVTFYAPFLSGSALTTISLPSTDGLPPRPVFVHSTEAASIYVAESGTNKVAVISAGASQVSQEISVGTTPVALAETPDGSKLYVVNKGSGTVTVVATLDEKPIGTITVGSNPVWAIATPDSKFIFVLNRGSNSVSVISTSNNQSTVGQVEIGASADVDAPLDNPMFFDNNAQRLYVVNSTSNTLSVFDTSHMATNPVPVEIKPQSPIALPVGSGPISVAALADGSRVYTGNSNGTVSIIDARALVLKTTSGCDPAQDPNKCVATLAIGPRVTSLAASADGSKVYATSPDPVMGKDPGRPERTIVAQPSGTAIISTASDSLVKPMVQPWTANTAISTGAVVVPTADNGHIFRASVSNSSGSTGATEPAWCTTAGCTVTDGQVTWTEWGVRNAIQIPAPFQDPVNCVSDNATTWVPNNNYVLNSLVIPTASSATGQGHIFKAVVAHTSGTTEPTWCSESGCQVTVDVNGTPTVLWTEVGTTGTAPACPRQRPMWVLTSTP